MNKLLALRSSVLVCLTHNIALPILKIVRKPQKFCYTILQLKNFESGSLGNDLYLFLTKRKLNLLPYYVRHDLKHIVLQYDTTDEGEACLQCFMLGNGRISFPVIATVLYAFCTMPEHWGAMRKAYLKGKISLPIHNWKWSELLQCQTKSLQLKLMDV